MLPAVPIRFTQRTRFTFEIDVTAVPGGRLERSNLMYELAVPPTSRNGRLPKLVPGKAVLTCASSLGDSVCADSPWPKAKAKTHTAARPNREYEQRGTN